MPAPGPSLYWDSTILNLIKCLDSTEANLSPLFEWGYYWTGQKPKPLGIHIDQDLDFDAQSDALCKLLSKTIGLL